MESGVEAGHQGQVGPRTEKMTGIHGMMGMENTESVRAPRVAIIAHDGKKADLVAFASFNRKQLEKCRLVATGTTGSLLADKVGLTVERVESGPIGGDAQIASRIVEGGLDAVLFIVDPLDKHPHDPDIQTLLRICNVWNIPLATNIASADMLVSSSLLWEKSFTPAVLVSN